MRLRNAPTQLMKGLGYGKGYRYAHDEEGAYAAGEHYLPDDMTPQQFYTPTDRGLEAKIREKLARLRAQDGAAATTRATEPTEATDCAGGDCTGITQASDRIGECLISTYFAMSSQP